LLPLITAGHALEPFAPGFFVFVLDLDGHIGGASRLEHVLRLEGLALLKLLGRERGDRFLSWLFLFLELGRRLGPQTRRRGGDVPVTAGGAFAPGGGVSGSRRAGGVSRFRIGLFTSGSTPPAVALAVGAAALCAPFFTNCSIMSFWSGSMLLSWFLTSRPACLHSSSSSLVSTFSSRART